jgi:hypothetical protein
LQAGGGVGQDGSNRWKGWSEPGGSLMDEDILPPCARLTSRCPSAPGSDAHLDSRRRSGRGEGDRAPAGRHTAEERHRTARCGASEPRGGQGQAGRGHGQGLHRQGTVPAAGSQLECHNKNSKKRRKHRSLAECCRSVTAGSLPEVLQPGSTGYRRPRTASSAQRTAHRHSQQCLADGR